METDSEGNATIKKIHAYFHQVQTEINVCEEETYADFVMWNEVDISITRMYQDKVFWSEMLCKANEFLQKMSSFRISGKILQTTHFSSN